MFSKDGTRWHISGCGKAFFTCSETITGPGQNKYCLSFISSSFFQILQLSFENNRPNQAGKKISVKSEYPGKKYLSGLETDRLSYRHWVRNAKM
jgi:hypothetical protein